jgi:hypothetical protein
MGVESIFNHHNVAGIRALDGGRWDIGAVHRVLTRADLRRPPPLRYQILEDPRT